MRNRSVPKICAAISLHERTLSGSHNIEFFVIRRESIASTLRIPYIYSMLQSPTHFKPRDMTFSLVDMLLLSSLPGKVIYAIFMRQDSVENAKSPRKTETKLLPPRCQESSIPCSLLKSKAVYRNLLLFVDPRTFFYYAARNVIS